MYQSLSLRENCKEIFGKLLGAGGLTRKGNDKATPDGFHTALQTRGVQGVCEFSCRKHAQWDQSRPTGEIRDKVKSRHKWSFPHMLLEPSSKEMLRDFKNSLKGQQIKELAPTGVSLSSSIYNAMELKITRRKQVRKHSVFLLG